MTIPECIAKLNNWQIRAFCMPCSVLIYIITNEPKLFDELCASFISCEIS